MVTWGRDDRRAKSGVGLYPRKTLPRMGGEDHRWNGTLDVDLAGTQLESTLLPAWL